MTLPGTLHTVGQMLGSRSRPTGRRLFLLHDQPELTFWADRPVAVQVDGDYLGERLSIRLTSVPAALRVVA
jgi:diacylglycerol kinase family enzyme